MCWGWEGSEGCWVRGRVGRVGEEVRSGGPSDQVTKFKPGVRTWLRIYLLEFLLDLHAVRVFFRFSSRAVEERKRLAENILKDRSA